MQHGRRKCRLGRTTAHNRCLMANMLKSLIRYERIETTITKAKELRRHADGMITLAKKNSLAARRLAIGRMMVSFNSLTFKEQRLSKAGDKSSHNDDRGIINKLFDVLGLRFAERKGGYTRIFRTENRVGDNAQKCIIEFLAD